MRKASTVRLSLTLAGSHPELAVQEPPGEPLGSTERAPEPFAIGSQIANLKSGHVSTRPGTPVPRPACRTMLFADKPMTPSPRIACRASGKAEVETPFR